MTINDKLIALIRTGVPALIGAFLAWLIARIPAVAEVIAALDAVLTQADFAGVTVLGLLQAIAIAAVIALYYWTAGKLSERFPVLRKWLQGSSLTPTYIDARESGVITMVSAPGVDPRELGRSIGRELGK